MTCPIKTATDCRNKQTDAKSTTVPQLIHIEQCSLIEPAYKDEYKYAIAFNDDYRGTIFPYFIKAKSDITKATENLIADEAPNGKIKCITSDKSGEFTGQTFQSLLMSNRIRHEMNTPYSTHQNGIAERGRRTSFEMSRYILLDSNIPKQLWTEAVQTAAQIHNRCDSKRLEQTPYSVFT